MKYNRVDSPLQETPDCALGFNYTHVTADRLNGVQPAQRSDHEESKLINISNPEIGLLIMLSDDLK